MKNIRTLRRETIYRGRIISLIRETMDVQGRRIIRETIRHPGAVVIVPLLDRAHIILVKQYRRAVDRMLLELPAGTLEPGEQRAQCARRELEEETGWQAGSLRRIAQFYAAPGFMSEQLTLFLAQQLRRSHAHPEPDECVTPLVLSFREALAKIRSGAICDAKTIIGVLFAQKALRYRECP